MSWALGDVLLTNQRSPAHCLQEDRGLIYMFQNFHQHFQSESKGRGHEVGDLKRLLEMYQRWQNRIFPHGGFDQFIEGLEKLSSNSQLKVRRLLRQHVKCLLCGAAVKPEAAARRPFPCLRVSLILSPPPLN